MSFSESSASSDKPKQEHSDGTQGGNEDIQGQQEENSEVKPENEANRNEEIVNYLKEWLPHQKHIPDVKNEKLLYHFAASSKGNIHTACKKIDSYFTVRTLIPDFYDTRDPTSDAIVQSCNCISLGFLPGLASDGSKVMLISLLKREPTEFEFLPFIRRLFMYIDLNFVKDLNPGQGIYFLTDCQNSSLNHVMKLTPSVVRKCSVCFQFHLYGHEYSKLFAIIPKEILPRDAGGHGPSYREISETAQEQLVSERNWLLTEGSDKSIEIHRNGKCPISSTGCCIM
ncbi:hypothetical protein O3M35_007977 [Rhynocoris fuscipes]|uniref:CRAL-TRIO domain-containing protein n=1 Tax=Rhynocoris fuscipes TaxID=488301 RepID=A0AAW1DDV5_9HEMI